MKNLTKREKFLLYILLCVIIFVVGVFLLCIPAVNKYTDLSAQADTVNAQYQTLKASVVDYSGLEKKIKDAQNDYKKQIEKFYVANDMKPEDVDNLITSLAVSHGLTPTALNISEITSEEVINYSEYLEKQKKEAEGNTEQSTAPVNEANSLKVYNVSLKVKGTVSALQRLVNDANSSKSLQIESVNYSEQEDEDKDMTVTFKLFMI